MTIAEDFDGRSPAASAILSAAIDVVAQQGMENFTMRALAARANCSIGTLTYHFKSKEEIVRTIFDHVLKNRIEVFLNFVPNDDPRKQIKDMISKLLPLNEAGDRDWRVILYYWSYSLHEPLAEINPINSLLNVGRAMAKSILHDIRRMPTTDEVEMDASEHLSVMVAGLAFSMLHKPFGERPAMLRTLDRYIDTLI